MRKELQDDADNFQILDRAIITPDLSKTFPVGELLPADAKATANRELTPGSDITAPASCGCCNCRAAMTSANCA